MLPLSQTILGRHRNSKHLAALAALARSLQLRRAVADMLARWGQRARA